MTLVPTDGSNDTLKMCEELWSKTGEILIDQKPVTQTNMMKIYENQI